MTVRVLADESCDFAMVRAMRAAGHDVVAVAEVSPRLRDSDVIALALAEGRVLLTEDKDFGQLVFAAGHGSTGVLLVRYPTGARSNVGDDVVRSLEMLGDGMAGSFVTLAPGKVRIARLPQ